LDAKSGILSHKKVIIGIAAIIWGKVRLNGIPPYFYPGFLRRYMKVLPLPPQK
jgi:hypothetical protein